jgi:acetylornithine deacetylase/succinyl-diaminopimelate desuccinylase-like protein
MSRPVVLALILFAHGVFAQDPYRVAASAPGFDRAQAQRDTLEHLKRLIALDTQNPPGNEIITARYLDSALRGVAGVETDVLDPGDGRANFVARLRAARPTKRPVLVMGHMEDELRMHGDNERVPIAALGWAAEYLYRVLHTVSAR